MMLDQTKHILFFESCSLTKGASRTLLVDHQRNDIHFLENEVYTIFKELVRKYTISDILFKYPEKEQNLLIEYFEFLLEHEFAFLVDPDEVDLFPELNEVFDTPEIISNAIIDLGLQSYNLEVYGQFIRDLSALGCENAEIRDFSGQSEVFWNELMQLFEGTLVYRVEICARFNEGVNWEELVAKYPRIIQLTVHSSPENFQDDVTKKTIVKYIDKVIGSNAHCGLVSPHFFNLDLRHYLESRSKNTCLNKKVSLDIDGEIKNCPSMKGSFGNISEKRITEVIGMPAFQEVWDLSKDLIETCKVCEFRNICTDCRAFHAEDLSNDKPAKCSYNPTTMLWNEGIEIVPF